MKRLLYCLSLLLIGACKKSFLFDFSPAPVTLPVITNEGKGTFGCLVNNRIWVPNEYKDKISCEYLTWKNGGSGYGTLSIKSSKRHFFNDKASGLNMTLHNRVFTTGKAPLYFKSSTHDYIFLNTDTSFYYDNLQQGSDNFINISRLDTVNRIISGTFQCALIDLYEAKDTLRITEGRFDLRF